MDSATGVSISSGKDGMLTPDEILPPHDHLMGSFKAFLPEKAKLLLTKLVS